MELQSSLEHFFLIPALSPRGGVLGGVHDLVVGEKAEVVLSWWILTAQWHQKGLMYGVENRFKMQLLLGLKRPHCEMGIQQRRTTSKKTLRGAHSHAAAHRGRNARRLAGRDARR